MLIISSLNVEMGTLVLTFSEPVSSEKATVSIPRVELHKSVLIIIVGADMSAVKVTVGLHEPCSDVHGFFTKMCLQKLHQHMSGNKWIEQYRSY